MRWRSLADVARRQPLGTFGAVTLIAMVAVAVLAPLVAPFDPLVVDSEYILGAPNSRHLFGTDNLGRDVLSRLIFGSQVSLYVGLVSVGISAAIGAVIGILTGYLAGKVDLIAQRFLDALMSFPMLVLALAIMAVLGQSLNNVVVAIAIVQIPRTARVIRSAALSVKEMQYVDAARSIGSSDMRIVLVHILPNCLAPLIVYAAGALGQAITVEATLSFLGLGTPPPLPSWGSMISGEARSLAQQAPWLPVFPGLALSIAVYAVNLLGDSLRDVLDPRLRR